MSLKKQARILSKLYSIWEEFPGHFLDETEFDSYLHHSFSDISTVETQLVRLNKSSNKNSFTSKVFKFGWSKFQQRFFLVEKSTLTKQDLVFTLYCVKNFL